ncbi:MAG: PDZ domain-containing protein, partial [Angelakisella sp.]
MFYLDRQLPDSFSVVAGEAINLPYPIQLDSEQAIAVQKNVVAGNSFHAQVRLMGAIPVKSVEIKVVDRKLVRISGAPFGIKMFTDGLMVVGMSDVAGDGVRTNPAKEAGMRVGDIVERINGVVLRSNEQLGGMVEQSEGAPMRLAVRR